MISISDFKSQITALRLSPGSQSSDDDGNAFKCTWEDQVLSEVNGLQIKGSDSFGLPEASKTFIETIQPNSQLESLKPHSKEFPVPHKSVYPANYSSIVQTASGSSNIYLEIAFMEPTRTNKYTTMATFIVPSDFLLSDLANAFDCPCDHIIINEEKAQGRFFFFENTFYNDTLVDQDLSESIISWKHDRAFSKNSMHQSKFLDLVIRLDYPYLYAHAGGCEHVVYIRQVRSSMPDDIDSVRCIFKSRPISPKCDLCELNTPEKVTWNDFYAPKSPCFWCWNCFKEFHYDNNDNAVYLFDSVSVKIQ